MPGKTYPDGSRRCKGCGRYKPPGCGPCGCSPESVRKDALRLLRHMSVKEVGRVVLDATDSDAEREMVASILTKGKPE